MRSLNMKRMMILCLPLAAGCGNWLTPEASLESATAECLARADALSDYPDLSTADGIELIFTLFTGYRSGGVERSDMLNYMVYPMCGDNADCVVCLEGIVEAVYR
jgi:hypothetical protein